MVFVAASKSEISGGFRWRIDGEGSSEAFSVSTVAAAVLPTLPLGILRLSIFLATAAPAGSRTPPSFLRRYAFSRSNEGAAANLAASASPTAAAAAPPAPLAASAKKARITSLSCARIPREPSR